jgi:hypothetical protein
MHDIHILTEQAEKHLRDTLSIALEHTSEHRALIIYDTDHALTRILMSAYQAVLPHGEFVDFNTRRPEEIIALFDTLSPKDLVILIQSSDFRLNAFRIRIQLFARKLKVIDHRHLNRHPEETWGTYIASLAYDPTWYRDTGRKLIDIVKPAQTIRIQSGEHEFVIAGGIEDPKPNLGDYTGMENIGGTFPIGEVFTEAKDLSKTEGSLVIYAFANTDYLVHMYEPFRIDIKDGIVTSWSDNAPDAFVRIFNEVAAYERPMIREIGFGLNRAITRATPLHDITAFERTLGLHFSLGEKHTVFKKPGIAADKTRYHVDIFPIVDTVHADNALIFQNNAYTV